MNRYTTEVVERMIINIYRGGSTEEAYDAIFDNPDLRGELERDDLTACEMLDRIRSRAQNRSKK